MKGWGLAIKERLVGVAVAASLAGSLGWACVARDAVAAASGTASSTQARVYSPFRASGRPAVHVIKTVLGFCWEGSAAVPHRRAWRCMSGNFIYDPCFSSWNSSGTVLCPSRGPWVASAIKIRLTRKLPVRYGNKRKASTSGLPWALVTVTGWKCRLDTGATSVIGGQRLNYFCTRTQLGLWGAPDRTSEPWTIYAASPQAQTLTDRVGIRAAWF